jgi:hypothetical protein
MTPHMDLIAAMIGTQLQLADQHWKMGTPARSTKP